MLINTTKWKSDYIIFKKIFNFYLDCKVLLTSCAPSQKTKNSAQAGKNYILPVHELSCTRRCLQCTIMHTKTLGSHVQATCFILFLFPLWQSHFRTISKILKLKENTELKENYK